MGTGEIYALYQKIQADQTGYRYVQQQRPGLSREQAQKVQKLSLEMVIYKRPLALLRAEDYSLEQVMKVCQFRHAELFYQDQQKGERLTGEIYEFGFVLANLQAKALMHLGKKYNHPDWVEFGQEMYDAYQKRIVVKDMKRLGLREGVQTSIPFQIQRSSLNILAKESDVYGRDAEKEAIIKFLQSDGDEEGGHGHKISRMFRQD